MIVKKTISIQFPGEYDLDISTEDGAYFNITSRDVNGRETSLILDVEAATELSKAINSLVSIK
jgi:hypothetical protein